MFSCFVPLKHLAMEVEMDVKVLLNKSDVATKVGEAVEVGVMTDAANGAVQSDLVMARVKDIPTSDEIQRAAAHFLENPDELPQEVLHRAVRSLIADHTNKAMVAHPSDIAEYLETHPTEGWIIDQMVYSYALARRKRIVDDRVSASVRDAIDKQRKAGKRNVLVRIGRAILNNDLAEQTEIIKRLCDAAADIDALEREKLKMQKDLAEEKARVGEQARGMITEAARIANEERAALEHKLDNFKKEIFEKEAILKELNTYPVVVKEFALRHDSKKSREDMEKLAYEIVNTAIIGSLYNSILSCQFWRANIGRFVKQCRDSVFPFFHKVEQRFSADVRKEVWINIAGLIFTNNKKLLADKEFLSQHECDECAGTPLNLQVEILMNFIAMFLLRDAAMEDIAKEFSARYYSLIDDPQKLNCADGSVLIMTSY